MVRGGQALILKAAETSGVALGQAKLSRYFSGEQNLRYSVAVSLSEIFEGTTPDDWMRRRMDILERAVVKWGARHCENDACRKRWSNYRFK